MMKGQSDVIEEMLVFSIGFVITISIFFFVSNVSDRLRIESSELVVKNNAEKILNAMTKAEVVGVNSSFILYVDPVIDEKTYPFLSNSSSDTLDLRLKTIKFTVPMFMLYAYGTDVNEYSSGHEFFIMNNGSSLIAKRFNPLDFGAS